jgi:hypothetical protein
VRREVSSSLSHRLNRQSSNCTRFGTIFLSGDPVRERRRGHGRCPLGQKRTYAVQKGTSALPPIATAKADSRKRSCPFYPRKRTCAVQLQMSAMGQKRTSHRYLVGGGGDSNRPRTTQNRYPRVTFAT